MSWKRVSREMARVFFAQDQHIAIVTGKKPRCCKEIELVEVGQNPRVPLLVVQCRCNDISQHGHDQRPENYCLVQPIFPGRKHPYLKLLHRDGSDLVRVEPINCSRTESPALSQEVETPETENPSIISATGFSQNFSLDEAFKDALHKLRIPPVRKQELSVIDVVSMGAAYGGFSGFSRLFVKIEQSTLVKGMMAPESSRKKMATVKNHLARQKKNNSRC